jgi:hypothetical protein
LTTLDNAVIEAWHSTLEFELRSLEHFATRARARAAVAAWIEDYNTARSSPGVPSVSHDVAPVALRIAFATHLQGCGARCCRCSEARPSWTCHMHDNLAWRRRVVDDATTCTIL